MTQQRSDLGSSDPRNNRFLAQLKQEDLAALMLKAKIVTLKLRRPILKQDEQIEAVYFPLTCMFSLLVTNEGEPQIELATIGNEGVTGASEALQNQGSVALNLVQIPGNAVRIDAISFRKLAGSGTAIQQLTYQHMYALLRQVLYGAACNRIHSMEERCARWLLMTHDRAGQDTFPLTQEFLSHMLGVRRATVNVATGMLKKAGFIQYVRGHLTVIDRPGLESASCACYKTIFAVYASLFPERPAVKH